MRILVTNDDGIAAPGLLALARAASRHGEVKVVAPDRERSCCGHAMTMRDPLRIERVDYRVGEAWTVTGFPVDCVNVGRAVAWPDGCDLVLSGVNNGPNLGFDVTYSGTVGGAIEGTMAGIRSIAFSVAALEFGEPLRYDGAEAWIGKHLPLLISAPLPSLTLLNVNVPDRGPEGIVGHRVAPMGRRVFAERLEFREDPWGRTYGWQGGLAVLDGEEAGSDVATVRDGYVSITPISVDWTRADAMASLTQYLGNGLSPSAPRSRAL